MDSQKRRVQSTWRRGEQTLGAEARLAEVDAAGLVCTITIPAGELLVAAELTLRAPPPDTRLILRALGTASAETVALPEGAVVGSAASGAASWFTIDLGARRSLQALRLKSAATAVRLKLADGAGPFYSASPADVIALTDDFVTLPEMTASRLLLELGTLSSASSGKGFVAAPTPVTQLDLQVAAGPPDVSAQLNSAPPFFHHPLPLPSAVTLRDELLAALLRCWPADLAGGQLTLTLRASAPGRILLPELLLRTATVVRRFSGGATRAQLPIRWDAVNRQDLNLPAGSGLAGLRFRMDTVLPSEQPLSTRTAAGLTLRCAPGSLAGLGFPALPEAVSLTGIDLCLTPLTPSVRCTVTLHLDHAGQPEAAPLPGATVQFVVVAAGNPPWAPRWVRAELPLPVALPPQRVCWVVVALSDGAALWGQASGAAGPTEPAGGDSVGFVYCTGGNPWRPVVAPPGLLAQGAGCRLRQRAAAPPVPRITLQGHNAIEVSPDAQGIVCLSAAQLDALRPPSASGTLQVQVDSVVDGAVSFSDLWMQLK